MVQCDECIVYKMVQCKVLDLFENDTIAKQYYVSTVLCKDPGRPPVLILWSVFIGHFFSINTYSGQL